MWLCAPCCVTSHGAPSSLFYSPNLKRRDIPAVTATCFRAGCWAPKRHPTASCSLDIMRGAICVTFILLACSASSVLGQDDDACKKQVDQIGQDSMECVIGAHGDKATACQCFYTALAQLGKITPAAGSACADDLKSTKSNVVYNIQQDKCSSGPSPPGPSPTDPTTTTTPHPGTTDPTTTTFPYPGTPTIVCLIGWRLYVAAAAYAVAIGLGVLVGCCCASPNKKRNDGYGLVPLNDPS